MFRSQAKPAEDVSPNEKVSPLDFDTLELVEGLGPALSLEYQSNEIDLYDFLLKWDGHYTLENENVDAVMDKVKELKELVWSMPMFKGGSAKSDVSRKWYKLWNVDPVTDIAISEIYWCTDIVLFRYLRSYKYDVKVAFHMLKKTLAWRRFRNVDSISPDVVGPANAGGMLYRKGYDNSARPIVYFRPQQEVDTDRDSQQLLLYFTLERATQTVLLDHGNDKVFVILDLNGWSLGKIPTLEIVIDTVRALSEHYTDVLHEVLIVDPPMLMDPVLQMIKAVLDSSTAKKIVVKPRGPKLEAYLKGRININYLEESMGGNNKTDYDHSAYWENEKREFLRYHQRKAEWIGKNEAEWAKSHANDETGDKACDVNDSSRAED